jgi:hypothetical protein
VDHLLRVVLKRNIKALSLYPHTFRHEVIKENGKMAAKTSYTMAKVSTTNVDGLGQGTPHDNSSKTDVGHYTPLRQSMNGFPVSTLGRRYVGRV